MNSYLFRPFALLLLLTLSQAGYATSFSLIFQDSAGEGINDATPATPVGGNTGTTIGEQRQITIEYAAAMLEKIIDSNVPIQVEIDFNAMSCSSNSATLAAAGALGWTQSVFAPLNNTWYPYPLLSALLNYDIAAALNDVGIDINSSIDNNNNCLNQTNFYYGLDGNAGSDIDLLSTVLHEIIHGLGFQTVVNLGSGTPAGGDNDVYMRHLEDHSLNRNWSDNPMSNAQRAASATDDGDLHWTGNAVTTNQALTSGVNQGHVQMYAPNSLATGSSVSHFDTDATPNELMEPFNTGPKNSIGLARYLLQDIGWPMFASNAPIISTVNGLDLKSDSTTNITFSLMDNDTAMGSVSVTATSSNTSVIPNTGLSVSGTGRSRSLTIDPTDGTSGNVTVTLSASDGSNTANQNFVVAVTTDLAPVVTVNSPAQGSVFYTSPQTISGTANDTEDGNLSASINWTSSIDGALGSGSSINPTLSDGTHQITAEVTDSGGNPASDAITITVDLNGDADGDGLNNQLEILLGTDPLDSDSDGDFLNDFNEVNRDGDPNSYTPGVDTDPNNSDTDGDGAVDGADYAPLDPTSGFESISAMPFGALSIMAAILTLTARRAHNKSQGR